mgnify:CR=1 FL=1
MNLLDPGAPLAAVKGKSRVPFVDHRPPLSSPITLVVMLCQAVGFKWYGPEKTLDDGSTGTSCFLDTLVKYGDGTEIRRVVWAFTAGDRVEVGGDKVSIVQIGHFFRSSNATPEEPLGRGARAVFAAMTRDHPELWTQEMPFNQRGKLLLEVAATAPHREAQLILATVIELYRGFVWKLSTPVDHPPHPQYGYPLERHLRYKKGRRVGDVRKSICLDHRMEELRQFGLR